MNDPSTRDSRRTFIDRPTTLDHFSVEGEPDFAIDPPQMFQRGWFRAELDRQTRTASLSLIRLVGPEEAPV